MTTSRYCRLAALFVLLSLADLALTCYLLQWSDGEVYEANQFAAWVLGEYGFTGLAVLKGLTVVLAAAVVAILSHYRPAAAKRVAVFGCGAVGLVVLYSLVLWGSLGSCSEPDKLKSNAVIDRETKQLAQLANHGNELRAAVNLWTDRLAAGRCTLREAVGATLAVGQSNGRAMLDLYRGGLGATSDAECLSAVLVHGALLQLQESGATLARQRADELLTAYRAAHGQQLLVYVVRDVPGMEDVLPVEAAWMIDTEVASLSPATDDTGSAEAGSARRRAEPFRMANAGRPPRFLARRRAFAQGHGYPPRNFPPTWRRPAFPG